MFKMIGCDNQGSVGYKYLGVVAKFNYNGNIFTFDSMYSSTVKSIVVEDNKMTVQTRNTKYIFEID